MSEAHVVSAHRHSAIDTIVRAGYEPAAIRCEQRDDFSDVLGGAEATQRNIPNPIIGRKPWSRLGKLGGPRRRDNAAARGRRSLILCLSRSHCWSRKARRYSSANRC